MTRLKVVAILTVLLASQPAFARGGGGGGGGGGMSHGDHTTMTHSDNPTMTRGHSIDGSRSGRHGSTAYRTAEAQRILARIKLTEMKVVKLVNMGLAGSAQVKALLRQEAMLGAKLRRLVTLPLVGPLVTVIR